MHLTSPAAKYCLGNFNFYNIHILPKLLSYIQDSNEIAKVVQFLGASPRPPPGFLPLDPLRRWTSLLPRSSLYVHSLLQFLNTPLIAMLLFPDFSLF